MLDNLSEFLTVGQVYEHLDTYAARSLLNEYIDFIKRVQKVVRNVADMRWQLQLVEGRDG